MSHPKKLLLTGVTSGVGKALARQLKDRGYYVIACCRNAEQETELKAQAAQLGLSNVQFLGHVSEPDKAALLDACYGVVFPSHLRSEAFGVSLLEGAMYGKPMISSEIGTGTTFVNIGGETGLVVPPADPDALRQAMRQLWEHPEQVAAMGKNAYARYLSHFTADRMCQSYVDLYRRLVEGRG